MPAWKSTASIQTLLALFALAGVLAFNAFSKPLYAWDLLAYIGVVNSYGETDAAAIHERTFSTVREHVPTDVYQGLTGETGSAYKAATAGNPNYFVQQLPFYSVKPAFPVLMLALNKVGMNLVSAAYAIPRAAYFAAGLLLFFWIRRYRTLLFTTVATSLLVSLPFFVSLPRYSSPDSLSTLALLSVFYLIVERRNLRLALVLAALAVTIRPDTILLAGLLGVYAMWREPAHRIAAGTSLAVAVALYLIQVRVSGNYGWATLMYHSMVEFLHEPATFVSPLGLADYARIYYRAMSPEYIFGGTSSGSSYNIVMFVLLNVMALAAHYRRSGLWNGWTVALAINLLFIAAHWIALPGDKDRVIVGTCLLALVALATTTGSRRDADAQIPHNSAG